MKKISIVPELINSEDIHIFDENNMPVVLCNKSRFKLNKNIFSNPFIVVDNFEKEKSKYVEIKNIDLDYLNKLGYRLVSQVAKGRTKNYSRQRVCYMIENLNDPIANSTVLNNIPKEHFLEMDLINSRIRIRGKNVYPYRRSENATPWIEVEE